MTSFVSHTTVDCHHAYELSEWWKGLLGYVDVEDDPNEPGHDECMILDPDTGHAILFIEVPEGKTIKNRLHLDLTPTDRSRDEEVDRLLSHGATMHQDLRTPEGGWATLRDPEGNEFCILRSMDEVVAGPIES